MTACHFKLQPDPTRAGRLTLFGFKVSFLSQAANQHFLERYGMRVFNINGGIDWTGFAQ